MKYCPGCGNLLEHIGDDPTISCGGIMYYKCDKCKVYFKEDQAGAFAKPENLTEVDEHDFILRHLLDEKAKKDGGQ